MDNSPTLLKIQHIEKLGHDLKEIRNRALNTIATKYSLNLVDETNTCQTKVLLDRLLPLCTEQQVMPQALALLLRLANGPNFAQIVQEIGVDKFLEKIRDIENSAKGDWRAEISQIKDFVTRAANGKVCSSLETRKDTREVLVDEVSEIFDDAPVVQKETEQQTAEKIKFLPWQPLENSERKVLLSHYESLRYIDDTTAIISTCILIKDIILKDYPAEVFLQRPLLLRTLHKLLETDNTKTHVPVLQVINTHLIRLHARIRSYEDSCLHGTRWKRDSEERFFSHPDEEELKIHQLSIQEFCHETLKLALKLLCEKCSIEERNLLLEAITRLTDILSSIDDESKSVCCLFEAALAQWEKKCPFVYFTLILSMISRLHSPYDLSPSIRRVIFNSLSDPVLVLFFPQFHEVIFVLVKLYQDRDAEDAIKDYEEAVGVCRSMTHVTQLMMPKITTADFLKNFLLFLPSLEFHRKFHLMKEFFKLCTLKCASDEEILKTNVLLSLLAHCDCETQRFSYQKLHEVVEKYAGHGVTSETAGDKLAFLLQSQIWTEILSFGAVSAYPEVRRKAQEIITLLLNSRPFVSEGTWTHLLSTIRSISPILCSFAHTQTVLGRCVLRLYEPKTAVTAGISPTDLLLGNLRFLFSKDILVNEEAFARLCELLCEDDPHELKTPRVRDIKGLHLSSVCASVKPRRRPPQSTIPNPRVVTENLAVLRSDNNGTAKLTAASQLACALISQRTCRSFAECGVLATLEEILDSSLVHTSEIIPSTVIPIIKTLTNVINAHSPSRKALSSHASLIFNVFRSLLLFTADESFREEAVHLLFLLLFSDIIQEEDNGYMEVKLLLPESVAKIIHVPLCIGSYGKSSSYMKPSLRARLMRNSNVSRLLRTYWSALWMGEISALLTLNDEDLAGDNFSPGLPRDMKLIPEELEILRRSYMPGLLRRHLKDIETATNHERVMESLQKIQTILKWLDTLRGTPGTIPFTPPLLPLDPLQLPWSATFDRFLRMPPCCTEDEDLLCLIVKFLLKLVRTLPSDELIEWLGELVTNSSGVCLTLLKNMDDVYGISGRSLRYSLLELCSEVAIATSAEKSPDVWIDMLNVILGYLDRNSPTHLDPFLDLLVDLTGSWSWNYSEHKPLYTGLVSHLIGILTVNDLENREDCFMGCNVINNALLILGHLFSDGSKSLKDWTKIWQEALLSASGDSCPDLKWLLKQTQNRDPLTRASSLTIIAHMFYTNKSFQMLIEQLQLGMGAFWHTGLAIVLDDNECALVKEKAVVLLDNLTALGSRTDCSDFLGYLESSGVYGKIAVTSEQFMKLAGKESSNGDLQASTPTADLIAAQCNWIFSIILLDREAVARQLAETRVLYHLAGILNLEIRPSSIKMYFALLRTLRACCAVEKCAQQTILSSPQNVRSLWLILGCSDEGSNTLSSVQSEAMLLLSLLLQESSDVVMAGLQMCELRPVLTNIHKALITPCTKKSASILVNNLAASKESSFIFWSEYETAMWGEVIADCLIKSNLTENARTLANLFGAYAPSQCVGLNHGIAAIVVTSLQKIAKKLNVNNVDFLRRSSVRKKVDPCLEDVESLYLLAMNLSTGNPKARDSLASAGLPEAVHKLWPWHVARNLLMNTALKMLCTYTHQSERASQSLALTCTPAGGVKTTLIQSIIALIKSEMKEFGKSHDLATLQISLQLLSNACEALECRVAISKSNLTEIMDIFLPTSKKGVPAVVLLLWLKFLKRFTCYPEGQVTVCKDEVVMEILLSTARANQDSSRMFALEILKNLVFHPHNKCRMLSSPAAFLDLLLSTLESEKPEEVGLAAVVLWTLAANSQKTKLLLRSAGFDGAISQALRYCTDEKCERVLDQALLIVGQK